MMTDAEIKGAVVCDCGSPRDWHIHGRENGLDELIDLARLGLWAEKYGIELVKQSRHARSCNAPYGQTEKFPDLDRFNKALAALPKEQE